MAQQIIGLGSAPDDGTGDPLRTGGDKINDNFTELYGMLDSGSYTPTLTNGTNVAASTAHACQYMRVGTVVTVSGEVSIDPTASGTTTNIGISLPISSDFSQTTQCCGVLADGFTPQYGAINGNTTDNRAEVEFQAATTSNRTFRMTFTYLIV